MKVRVCSCVRCVFMLALLFIWSCVVCLAAEWRENPVSGAGVYSVHGCCVGLCTLFLLPGSQHLAGQCYRHTSEQKYRQNLCFINLLFLSVNSENSSWVSWTQQRLHPAFLLWRPWCLALPLLHRHVWILPGMLRIQTYNISPTTAWLGSNLSTGLLGPPHLGWWPRHRPERQNLCLLDFSFHF